MFKSAFLKPGKGVDKNEPEMNGFKKFWVLLWRKLSKHLLVNVLYFLCSIIWIMFLFAFSPIRSFTESFTANMEPDVAELVVFGLNAAFAILLFNTWGFAPVTTAYAYIMRSFTREEHAWIFHDSKKQICENIKNSMLLLLLDIIVFIFVSNALIFYNDQLNSSGEYIYMILKIVLAVVLIVYTLAHYYIYQIMITFECKFKTALKNAFICAIADLPMAILLSVINITVVLFIYFRFNTLFALIILIIIGTSFTRYPIEFHATRFFNKNIEKFKQEKESN